MEIKYVKDIDVLNIELQAGKFAYSEDLADGVILDLSQDGEILGIEVIGATKRLQKGIAEKLSQRYLATA